MSAEILLAIGSYLLGSVPFGLLMYRLQEGGDVRSIGSGNIGATNVLRGAGTPAAIATLLLDAGKGYVAVAVVAHMTAQSSVWMSIAAVAVICGHVFSLFLRFRGGKGVATGLGAFLALAPIPTLWCVTVFLLVAAATRYVSLASIVAVAAYPLLLLVRYARSTYELLAAGMCAVIIIARHRSNISRLIAGTEHQVHLGANAPRRRTAER
jgi:acyl phosphate:glycerol-3-phosphate acyltransferase